MITIIFNKFNIISIIYLEVLFMSYYCSKKAILSICLLTALSSQNVLSMSMLRSAISTTASSLSSRISKFAFPAALIAGAGIAMSLKMLATRYLNLGAIEASINPQLDLDATPEDQSVYNWNVDIENFRTVTDIYSHQREVRTALIQACTAGQLAIYKHDRLNERQAQGLITWQDVSATLDKELRQLENLKTKMNSFVDISINVFHRRLHIFGVNRNYQTVCSTLGIKKEETMSREQEADLNLNMMHERGRYERILALLMFNPNYNKAHKIYWQVRQRQKRLQAISTAIASISYEPKAFITQPMASKQN